MLYAKINVKFNHFLFLTSLESPLNKGGSEGVWKYRWLQEVVGKLFPTCEKISIDYAVMEKSKEIYTLPAEFGWSDLGSWGSLRTLLPQDEAGNAKVGKDIRLYECKNCVAHAADESKVVVQGLDGYIVAEKHGQLLVCSLKEEQRIKEFGEYIKLI